MEPREGRRAVFLTMAIFFLQPLGFGVWLALIPHVKDTLGLSKSELAVALLGLPLALLVTLQVAGRVVGWLGLRRMMAYAFAAQGAAAILPLLAVSQETLFLALAGFGFAAAFLEVGLNAYAGRLEPAVGRLVMNRCHGFWALGLMAGSLLVVGFAEIASPLALISIVSLLSCAAGASISHRLPRAGATDGEGWLVRRPLRDLPRALLFIGAFMFLMTLIEGAMGDWAAVYLAERVPGMAAQAGIAVSIFSAFLAAGRFAGDALESRFGPIGLARGSALVGLLGVGCLVLPLPIAFAYLGFAMVGLGVAAGYPLGVSAVSALDEAYQPANVAIMSTSALAGFLIGPPLIGFLGDAIGLQSALAVLAPAMAACLWLSNWLAPGEAAPAKSEAAS